MKKWWNRLSDKAQGEIVFLFLFATLAIIAMVIGAVRIATEGAIK